MFFFLEKVWSYIKKTNCEIVHTQSYIVKGNCFKVNDWWDSFDGDLWATNFVEEGRFLLNEYGRFKCPVINVSSAVFLKEFALQIEIPKKYRYCGDWWFWAQLFYKSKVGFIAEPLNYFRMHQASATHPQNGNNFRRIVENFEVIKSIAKLINSKVVYNKNFEWIMQQWVSQTVNNKQYKKQKYFTIGPSFLFTLIFLKRVSCILIVRFLKKIK